MKAADLLAQGKVRDIFEAKGDLMMVATDRISAFDVVLPQPIPAKGMVLTGLSLSWFDRTSTIVPNHVITADPVGFPEPFAQAHNHAGLAGRAIVVKRARMIPIECVARGYLSGSGWKDYEKTGGVCGVALPRGLVESDRLPEPIFTPATKEQTGHDLNISLEEAADIVGRGLAEKLREVTLSLYAFAATHALERGIILADTKFEFGLTGEGRVLLIDEVMTPDSSRYWPVDGYEPGRGQPSFDKQFVRDWASGTGWDKTPPGPEIPDDIVEQTRARYRECYELVTDESLDDWLARVAG